MNTEAESVRLLSGAREAVEARLHLALRAEREILAQSFIVGDDPFSLTALALLRSAERRGVEVRLLVDAQWNKVPDAVMAHLRDEGLEIRLYHPFRIHKPRWITRRMHDKLLVVDGRALIAGGRNLESPYFGYGHQLQRANYIDLDLEVEGEVAREARQYFFELWKSDQVERNRAGASLEERQRAARELDRHFAWLADRIERRDPAYRADPSFREVEQVRFLHDPVGGKGRAPGTGHALLTLLDAACRSARVESPYLIPTRALKEGIERARERGVRVRILTNSLNTTDNLWPQAGYVGERHWLVQNGVELWEYAGPESLHSKAAVLDDRTVVVGSFNLDPRSEFLNTEIALVVDDPGLAAELSVLFDSHLEGSWWINERGYPDGSLRRFPGVSAGKVLKLQLLKLFAPLVRRQL